MNIQEKLETLMKALRCCRFPENYFIEHFENHFIIKVKNENGIISPHTKCMSYRELDAYLNGYYLALTKVPTQFYIEYLNKEKNYEQDSITFDTYQKAFAWAAINIQNFQPDMIKFLT